LSAAPGIQLTAGIAIMNCQFALAVVLATSAAGITAFADDISMEPVAAGPTLESPAARSVAELRAEEYKLQTGLGSPARTRAEVTAGFMAARDRVAAFNREDSGSSYLAQQAQAPAASARLAAVAE
jgi:hypothetical protein